MDLERDRERERGRSMPRPSATVAIASAVLVCAAALTSDAGVGRAGWLGGAATSAVGEAWREPVLDDIPFEDDHVRLAVPAFEREIATEELAWTSVAPRLGKSRDSEASWRDEETEADSYSRKSSRKKHRYEDEYAKGDDFELPDFEQDEKQESERREQESKELLSSQAASSLALKSLSEASLATSTSSDERDNAQLGKKESDSTANVVEALAAKSSELIARVEVAKAGNVEKSENALGKTSARSVTDDVALAEIEKKVGNATNRGSGVSPESTTLTASREARVQSAYPNPLVVRNASIASAANVSVQSVATNDSALSDAEKQLTQSTDTSTSAVGAATSASESVSTTMATEAPKVEYKKRIDTTRDIEISNAARGDQEQGTTSWARKGLKPADENVLTEANIRQHGNIEDQALSVDFLSRFPVRLPKSERETQNWRAYKPSHKTLVEEKEEEERETKETVERVTAAAIDIVRRDKTEDAKEQDQWTNILHSLYFIGPVGVLTFVSIFYAVVAIVARKSANSEKARKDDFDATTFETFVFGAVSAHPKKSDGSLKSTLLGFMKRREMDSAPAEQASTPPGSPPAGASPLRPGRSLQTSLDTTLEPTPVDSPARPSKRMNPEILSRHVTEKLERWGDESAREEASVELAPSEHSEPVDEAPPEPVEHPVPTVTSKSSLSAEIDAPPPVPRVTSKSLLSAGIDAPRPVPRVPSKSSAGNDAPQPVSRIASKSSLAAGRNASPEERSSTREGPGVAPRRPGDAPSIVRSTTTKFYK